MTVPPCGVLTARAAPGLGAALRGPFGVNGFWGMAGAAIPGLGAATMPTFLGELPLPQPHASPEAAPQPPLPHPAEPAPHEPHPPPVLAAASFDLAAATGRHAASVRAEEEAVGLASANLVGAVNPNVSEPMAIKA